MKWKIPKQLMIPNDLSEGDMLVTITGFHEMYVENYRGIFEYHSNKITVAGKKYMLIIEGEYLKITYYAEDEMKIEGCFQVIQFCQ